MKMRRIFAGMAALAMTATMAISASADYTITSDLADLSTLAEDGKAKVYIFGGDDSQWPKIYENKAELEGITGYKVHVTFNEPKNPELWYGGGFHNNSKMGGWKDTGSWTYDAETKAADLDYETSYKKNLKNVDDDYWSVVLQSYFDEKATDAEKVSPIKSVEVTLLGVNAPTNKPIYKDSAKPAEEQKPAEETPKAGAAAGIALAGIAVAGAAFVATKRK